MFASLDFILLNYGNEHIYLFASYLSMLALLIYFFQTVKANIIEENIRVSLLVTFVYCFWKFFKSNIKIIF